VNLPAKDYSETLYESWVKIIESQIIILLFSRLEHFEWQREAVDF
jgi:hypothetical protein